MNKHNDDSINDGVLYFAQRIDEMLNPSTSHIYKAPVHNTRTLIKEYLTTQDSVMTEQINNAHLKSVFEEFLESYKNDVIIKKFIGKEERNSILNKLNTNSETEKSKLMYYLYHRLCQYNLWCKEYLLEIVPQAKEKKLIEQTLRSYVSGLIDYGYSSNYIRRYNKRVFNKTDENELNMLSEFVNRFDFKVREYDVYVALNKKSVSFKEILIDNLDVEFEFDKNKAKKFKYPIDKYILAKLKIEALDQGQAANFAYNQLNIFYKFYRFMNDDGKKWFLNKCMVCYSDVEYSFIDLKVQRYNVPEHDDPEEAGELSKLLITALLTKAQTTFKLIEKIISLHNTAIENTNLSNGFLNLWSILEVLFVSDNDCSKIKEIEKKLIPLLQKEYIVMIFKDLDNNLRDNLSREHYDEILNSIDGNENKYKIAALITLNKYEELRKTLYTYLKACPVLRSRIYQLSNLCKRKCDFLDELERFTKRIKWHLIRLYRTRNSIIHSGNEPKNLKLLGEHLHSYVDVCIWEIMVSLTTEKCLCSIENVLIDEMFQIERILNDLSSKEKFKEDDIFLCCNSIEYSTPPSIGENVKHQNE